jgi:DNA repair protein RecN (Recombination protein N)
MLLQLRVENYAVIDQATVDFGPGLNLLTGETGAGKSILIDALALLLGDKASSDVVRHGADKSIVACVFDLDESSTIKNVAVVLDENGIDASDDGTLILRREILVNGKGRVFINNQPATVTVLKQLAPALASIHAQNESIMAFDANARLSILDRYAGVGTPEIADLFTRVRNVRAQIEDLQRNEQDRLRLLDLWKFQHKEIAEARLESGEDQRLETEKRVLANSEKLYAAAMSAYDALYDGNANVASLLSSAERSIEELARYDDKFHEQVSALAAARATIEDASATVRDYADGINASPERLAEIEDRLALLDRLKRKYGATLEDVILYGTDVAMKLQQIENRDETLAELQKQLDAVSKDYLQIARAASKRRHDAAKKLERLVEAEINDLAMKSKFHIELRTNETENDWSSSGIDVVTYLIATNPGEPMKPIEEIASGGEMSRVMLALKASVEEGTPAATNGKKRSRHQRTLVFDEIDTGIGGRAAEAVGKKLKALARNNQVLCITHLPQIASFADQHFVIEKRESGGRTKTTIRALTPEQRTEEVARMLSGAKLTDTSLKHAEQMLKTNA